MKNILLLVHSGHGQEARIEVALDVVRAIGGHLTCLDVTVYPAMAGDYGDSSAILYTDECVREAKNKLSLEPRLLAEGVSWDWIDARGPLDLSLIKASGLADLIILNTMLDETGSSNMRGVVGEVLLRGHRPILAVPDTATALSLSGHAVIAWDGSDAAIDALRASVPLLRLAMIVTILEIKDGSVDTPAEDAATYLSRYGISATVRAPHALLDDAATIILREVGLLDPDYLVMGGFGHSRMREALFGGVTRRLLSESSIPLLLAH